MYTACAVSGAAVIAETATLTKASMRGSVVWPTNPSAHLLAHLLAQLLVAIRVHAAYLVVTQVVNRDASSVSARNHFVGTLLESSIPFERTVSGSRPPMSCCERNLAWWIKLDPANASHGQPLCRHLSSSVLLRLKTAIVADVGEER